MCPIHTQPPFSDLLMSGASVDFCLHVQPWCIDADLGSFFDYMARGSSMMQGSSTPSTAVPSRGVPVPTGLCVLLGTHLGDTIAERNCPEHLSDKHETRTLTQES